MLKLRSGHASSTQLHNRILSSVRPHPRHHHPFLPPQPCAHPDFQDNRTLGVPQSLCTWAPPRSSANLVQALPPERCLTLDVSHQRLSLGCCTYETGTLGAGTGRHVGRVCAEVTQWRAGGRRPGRSLALLSQVFILDCMSPWAAGRGSEGSRESAAFPQTPQGGRALREPWARAAPQNWLRRAAWRRPGCGSGHVSSAAAPPLLC